MVHTLIEGVLLSSCNIKYILLLYSSFAFESNNPEYRLHLDIENTMNIIQQTHSLPKVNNHRKYIHLQSFGHKMNAWITTYRNTLINVFLFSVRRIQINETEIIASGLVASRRRKDRHLNKAEYNESRKRVPSGGLDCLSSLGHQVKTGESLEI